MTSDIDQVLAEIDKNELVDLAAHSGQYPQSLGAEKGSSGTR